PLRPVELRNADPLACRLGAGRHRHRHNEQRHRRSPPTPRKGARIVWNQRQSPALPQAAPIGIAKNSVGRCPPGVAGRREGRSSGSSWPLPLDTPLASSFIEIRSGGETGIGVRRATPPLAGLPSTAKLWKAGRGRTTLLPGHFRKSASAKAES